MTVLAVPAANGQVTQGQAVRLVEWHREPVLRGRLDYAAGATRESCPFHARTPESRAARWLWLQGWDAARWEASGQAPLATSEVPF